MLKSIQLIYFLLLPTLSLKVVKDFSYHRQNNIFEMPISTILIYILLVVVSVFWVNVSKNKIKITGYIISFASFGVFTSTIFDGVDKNLQILFAYILITGLLVIATHHFIKLKNHLSENKGLDIGFFFFFVFLPLSIKFYWVGLFSIATFFSFIVILISFFHSKLKLPVRNLILLTSLSYLSILFSSLLTDYSFPHFKFDYEILKIIFIVLLYSLAHIIVLSKEKFKDFALLLIFIGLGGSLKDFHIYFEHYFHKIFFLGVTLLIFYILYEFKKNYVSIAKKMKSEL